VDNALFSKRIAVKHKMSISADTADKCNSLQVYLLNTSLLKAHLILII